VTEAALLPGLVPPALEDLYELVNERYERSSLIITSNRAFAEWPDLFGEPLLASAALDRLGHDAHQIVITGESYRTRATKRRSAEKRHADAANG
jgi:DNA replication protein DnaC